MTHALKAFSMVLSACLLVQSDAGTPEPRTLVLFLGHRTADRDNGFKYYKSLFAKARPDQWSRLSIDYVRLPDDWELGLATLSKALHRQPALVVAPSAGMTKFARRLAGRVPVVFASYVDPVASGFVDGLQRRADRITGIDLSDRLDGKRFEIMREAYPEVKAVAVLADSEWAADGQAVKRVEAAAHAFGMTARFVLVNSRSELLDMFRSHEALRYDAWYVPASYLETREIDTIIVEMKRIGRPCMYTETKDVEAGGLLSYAQDTLFAWPALVELSSRVLEGAAPGSIPILRPQRFELAVRVGPETGAALPSNSIVRRADRVIR